MKFILTLVALTFVAFIFSSHVDANNNKQSKSDSNNGVTFTINNYEKEGSNLKINYTVSSESKLEEGTTRQPFLDRPSFYVNQKLLNTSFSENVKKINSHKYSGYILLNISDTAKDHFNLKMKINRISNQVGNWGLGFDY